jgi:hypothetical protein
MLHTIRLYLADTHYTPPAKRAFFVLPVRCSILHSVVHRIALVLRIIRDDPRERSEDLFQMSVAEMVDLKEDRSVRANNLE